MTDSYNRQSYFDTGVRELDAGNVRKAIRAFKRAMHETPNDPRVYNNLGIAYELVNEHEKARSAYEKAIRVNPSGSGSLNNLADLSAREGNPDDAARLYESAITADPLFIEPYLNIARMFIELRQFESAEPYVRAVIDIESGNAEALNLLGIISSVTERSEEAVRHFQNALRHNANQAPVFSNLGAALQRVGDFRKAILVLEKAFELNPNSLSIMNNLGALYLQTEEFERSERLFLRAIEFYPESPFPHRNLADLYVKTGEYDKALDHLLAYLRIVPLDLDVCYRACGIARIAGRLDLVGSLLDLFLTEAESDDPRRDSVDVWRRSLGK